MATDLTLSDESLYGSILWTSQTMGMSKDNFMRRRPMMMQEGFPAIDGLTNLYLKADVIAWIDRRRQVGATIPDSEPKPEGVKIDAL